MSCTTVLVGKNVSYDGSTLVARNEDSGAKTFTPKHFIIINPKDQPKIYQSTISKVKIPLPKNPMRYSAVPDALRKDGIWAACGINEANVAMSATETITNNERVLGADPLVTLVEENNKIINIGGIGEEDMVTLVLPYIKSAKEGVLRLGKLLEEYGTYECNGIAFQDVNEIWWLETIGGHHWIAKKVPDNQYVIMSNQLGIDEFDLDDAFTHQKEHLCSKDLISFIEDNHLNLALDKKFNPRLAFGSHSDSDHVYNTPRVWITHKILCPNKSKNWEMEADNLPWGMIPERKISIEDIKYILSNHYQGTPYDPYNKNNPITTKGIYRPIGVSRTNFLGLTQIRPYLPQEIQCIQWMAMGSNPFNTLIPFYTNITKTPQYLSNTTQTVSTDSFYWMNRLIGALSDINYHQSILEVERYQFKVLSKAFELLNKYDKAYINSKSKAVKYCEKANQEITAMLIKETDILLDKVLYIASCNMKNGFSRSDN